MVVSKLFLHRTGKILSELLFSPCGNSRNQAATALGERLSFFDLYSGTVAKSLRKLALLGYTIVIQDINASLFVPLRPSRSAPVYFQISQTPPQIFIVWFSAALEGQRVTYYHHHNRACLLQQISSQLPTSSPPPSPLWPPKCPSR